MGIIENKATENTELLVEKAENAMTPEQVELQLKIAQEQMAEQQEVLSCIEEKIPCEEPKIVADVMESEDYIAGSEGAEKTNEEQSSEIAKETEKIEETAEETETEIEEISAPNIAKASDDESETEENIASLIAAANEPVLSEVTEIRQILRDMNARVSSLRKLADMHQEIENNLNNQINEYKDNLYRRIVNPILVEFFDVQEDMNIEAQDASEETAKILTEYVAMITKIFKHYGVTVETVEVGDVYDSRIHNPVKAIPTNEQALDKTIAKTRKSLVHSIDGKVVERASVHVYQYREEKSQETSEAAQSDTESAQPGEG